MTPKTRIKTSQEIDNIRTSGRMLAEVLRWLAPQAVDGVTTKHLADLARDELKRLGGKPAFLHYEGFPDVICISVNDQLVHGIPTDRVIHDGDLVGLDFGVNYGGMITDAAITIAVGGVTTPDTAKLLKATKESLDAGISVVRDGVKIGDLSAAIEVRLRRDGLGVIEDLVGHGVGHHVHEDPIIPNFGTAGQGPILRNGMTVAIEPMASLGDKTIKLAPDGWTISMADGSLAAHFEHTVLVTDEGAEVLTAID